MSANGQKLLSIMIPSRGRPEKLLGCLDKFLNQLSEEQRQKIEFVIKIDSDDTATLKIAEKLPYEKVDIQVVIASKLGGYRDLFRFYNQCARLAKGLFLMMWNDDASFRTSNWFQLFESKALQNKTAYSYWFAGTPSQIVRNGVNAGVEDWPCFIAHHRLLYEIIGFYGHQGGVDSFLYYVLGPLGLLVKIQEIEVDHIAWFDIPMELRDSTSHNNSQDGQMLQTDFRVVQFCQEKIKQYVASQAQQPQLSNQQSATIR